MMIKKTFYNEKLTCPECANIILEKIEKMEDVKQAFFDFDNRMITILSEKEITDSEVNTFIEDVLKNEHSEKHFDKIQNIVTDEYNFTDIDCPNCAAKVERALNKREEIIDAEVNFFTKKIYIKHQNKYELYNIVSKVVKSIESDAEIKKINKESDNEIEHEDHEHEHCHHHHSDEHSDHFGTCECGCHHHEEKTNDNSEKSKIKKELKVALTIFGIMLYLVCTIFHLLGKEHVVITICFIISYLLVSYDILFNAIWSIFHKDFFGENTLMVIASLGAVIIGEPVEGIMVILLFKVGELCQNVATDNSRNEIKKLIDIKVNEVTLKDGTKKNIKDVNVGEIVTIKVGERIPLDGIIKEGKTDLDMKALTGESMPVSTKEGEEILSGSINLSRVIDVEVTKKDKDSTISKVMKLVEEASEKKSKSEKFITKFARIYTPCILIIAILVGLIEGILMGTEIKDVFINVFTILVISCPCALVISIPLGYFAGIGCASKMGILVKGGNYLEALNKVDSFVFDKTGTMTKGNFKVLEINPSKFTTKEEVLDIVSHVEMYSNHPIAESIKKEYGKTIDTSINESIQEISGQGLKMKKSDTVILVGNELLMKKNNISYTTPTCVGTIIHLACNKKYYGNIVIGDEIKEESFLLFKKLKKEKYNTVMLTGDSESVANDIAKRLEISKVYSKLMPSQKYDILRKIIKEKKGSIVYVGDGINDTPALKLADVGIAMGALGSDSAKEASDIVIMNDDLNKISDAIDISKYTRKIITQNIIFALSVKLLALLIGIWGILESLGMIIAIFADVGICILAIVNVMRILRFKPNRK